MECQTDTRPHDGVSGTCVQCGYQYWTQYGFADKESLEENRADQEYIPLPMTDDMRKNILDYIESENVTITDAMKKHIGLI